MGAEQSKESSLNRASAGSCTEFQCGTSKGLQCEVDTGVQPTQDQHIVYLRSQPSLTSTVDTFNNGISNAAHSGSAEAVSVYGDVPFILSPAFCTRLSYQTYTQFHGIDINFANLSKYDYDFSLERSVLGH